MEIYKDLSSQASQQFEKLLNNQLSKNKIEEGKVIEGKITKITEKYVFLFIPGLKSEPVIDINEMKMIGMQDKIAEGETVSVLLERITTDRRTKQIAIAAEKIRSRTEKKTKKKGLRGQKDILQPLWLVLKFYKLHR